MIAVQQGLSPKRIHGEAATSTVESLVERYKAPNSQILDISFENDTLYSEYEGEEKLKLIMRENNAYSYECTEKYFQLREKNGKNEIVPVYLYQGEHATLAKL